MSKVIIFLFILFYIKGCVFVGPSGSAEEPQRRPCRYLIPDRYVGWVQIDYGVKGAPELPLENGFRVCRFPTGGRLSTSSPFEHASYSDLNSGKEDEFYYYSGDARQPLPAGPHWADGGMIWRHTHVEGGGGEVEAVPVKPRSAREETPGSTERESTGAESHEFFFVGTQNDREKYESATKDQYGNRKIGPVKPLNNRD